MPLISFVIVTTFTPGPNNISSASMGVLYGYRKTVGYLFGIASGFFVVMVVCACLSGTLLRLVPAAEQYLRWIGAGYILWLAAGVLRSDVAGTGHAGTALAFARGFMLQLVNPKVAIYGLTLYSTFLAPVAGQVHWLSLSALAFALTALAATSTWSLFGAGIRAHMQNPAIRRGINSVLALMLVYTALELSGMLG